MDALSQKIEVKLVDGNRLISIKKGIWDTQRQVIEVKKGFRKGIEVFAVKDAGHIYEHWEKRGMKWKVKLWAFVDNNTRETISFESEGAKITQEANPTIRLKAERGGYEKMDLKKRLALSFLSLEAFFKYIGGKQKIPTLQLIITMFAGYGILRFVEYFIYMITHTGA
jgi:hypothetical protein